MFQYNIIIINLNIKNNMEYIKFSIKNKTNTFKIK